MLFLKTVPVLLTVLLLTFISGLSAQNPVPCGPGGPFFASECATACVSCQVDGLTGINNDFASNGNVICGQIVPHNDVWLAFIAGSTSLTINVQTANCQNGDGLQIAFFEDCNAIDALACNPGSGGGAGSDLFLNYDQFVPGQVYYLMLDGFTGDVCDFTIQVTQGQVGTTGSQDLTGPLSGPGEVCPGDTVQYSIPTTAGIGYYVWTAPDGALINGLPSPVAVSVDTAVTVIWGATAGPVCVQSGNACSPGDTLCLPVAMTSGDLIQLPPATACAGEPYVLPWGDSVTVTGTYQHAYPMPGACDSIVRVEVYFPGPLGVNLGLINLCPGECFTVCDSTFCAPGTYAYGCQSV